MKTMLTMTLVLCVSVAVQAQSTTPIIRVTLLGTGTPLLDPVAYTASGRVNAATLVEAGQERLLFDIGQGVMTRLFQSGFSMNSSADDIAAGRGDPNAAVNRLFITHLHSDHIAELPTLYAYGWLFRYDQPLVVWGPGGGPNQPVATWEIMQQLRIVYDTDFLLRCCAFTMLTFPLSGIETLYTTVELWEGQVYASHGVTVTAFLVDHHPVMPAYGFRVDYQGHAVLISGDTAPTPNIVKYGTGVDVLVHEVFGFPRSCCPELYDYHTSPEAAAQEFAQAAPQMAVYTHIALNTGETDDDLVARTRAGGYSGPLTVGKDLMKIDITASGVTVTPPSAVLSLDRSRVMPARPFLPGERGPRMLPMVP